MRLSAMLELPGWTKRVVSPCPMEKACHPMMSRSVPWLIVRTLPFRSMVALP
jgi:hypothetical protein